ncbi:ATP-binding cassette domain-containing protein [Staphylococcus haemolyticus]|uniref:ATP-binding cassette domain-containing protein n=1 Tax=Staphylococcus haemolyticus TaxID=1283 RepID=UPI0029F8DA72|nr:ATP-binding cassette domain-containing protein [Staphylococcus haemolyticus]MCE4991680.1 ATP-binding cassette domain-containing protein [Staphylococcus haemolyticus]
MLEFKNISKNYRKKAILENINFKICKGEKVGLLGTNGAGKTTLMKLIAKSQCLPKVIFFIMALI